MGLAHDLGYSHRTANPAHRAVRAFGGSRPGAWFFSRTLRHIDDVVGRASNGRQSGPSLLAGIAVLDLTTTGRKSGQRRTAHLIATPIDGALAVIGTNFGQTATPAWVHNLEADPRATVTYRDQSREVVARRASADETTRVIAEAGTFYPGYGKYQQRITGREVRVFFLDPA